VLCIFQHNCLRVKALHAFFFLLFVTWQGCRFQTFFGS